MPRRTTARPAAAALRAAGALTLAVALPWAHGAAPPSPAPELPPEVQAALRRAQLPVAALSAIVQPLDAPADDERLQWQPDRPVNPASLFKLFTTQAALDTLGPAQVWRTPVLARGPLGPDGVLEGPLLLRGSGDPKLVVERLWLLLRRLQQLGVREVRGDLLLDRSAFVLPDEPAPGEFDGDASRPYNVRPDALLLNFKSVVYTFTPDVARGVARVGVEPPLAGVRVPAEVALAAPGAPCEDWRAGLQADWQDAQQPRWSGRYPAACGERSWPVAPPEPERYAARLLSALWQGLGGTLTGQVRDATAEEAAEARRPAGPWRQLAQAESPPLGELVRDINKYSNNLMAEQLFLSLPGLAPWPAGGALPGPAPGGVGPEGTRAQARAWLRQWLALRLGEASLAGVVVDNGSGLSREQRVTARLLARLLRQAWQGPAMPELLSSLPVSGLDGTLRRSTAMAGRAHLKTGSLRDVAAVAGYVLSDSGRRWLVVAVLNHPQAAAGRPALDALVQWTIRDAPAR